jgi:hypothetical protein
MVVRSFVTRTPPSVAAVRTVHLRTPPAPCVVPAHVFDAFGWCMSDELEWRCGESRWDPTTRVDGSDPARMVFVLRQPCHFLPSELARLHAFGLGLADEEALAPWAIDVATDELFARRAQPSRLLWLAADNLNALFWGLHDWAHFHHHGPFEERAWNELQCDTTALAWLRMNLEHVPLARHAWDGLRAQVEGVSRGRFDAEGKVFPAERMTSEAIEAMAAPWLEA